MCTCSIVLAIEILSAIRKPVALSTSFVNDDEVRAIVRHIEVLADQYPNLNIVIGGGLERNLDLWSYLAARFSVIGNSPRIIKHIKNPRTFLIR